MECPYKAVCPCGQPFLIFDFLFCPKCTCIRCPLISCTLASPDSAYCSGCFRAYTLTEARSAGFRCLQCFSCPCCSGTLRPTPINTVRRYFAASVTGAVPASIEEVAADNVYIPFCPNCNHADPKTIGLSAADVEAALLSKFQNAHAGITSTGDSSSDASTGAPKTVSRLGAHAARKPILHTKRVTTVGDVYDKSMLEISGGAVISIDQERLSKAREACLDLESKLNDKAKTAVAGKHHPSPTHQTTPEPVRLTSIIRRRCRQCVSNGDPGILLQHSMLPYTILTAGGRIENKPATFFRKISTATSVLPFVQLVPLLPAFPDEASVIKHGVPSWSKEMKDAFVTAALSNSSSSGSCSIPCLLRFVNPTFGAMSICLQSVDTAEWTVKPLNSAAAVFAQVAGFEELEDADTAAESTSASPAAVTLFGEPETSDVVCGKWRHTTTLRCCVNVANPQPDDGISIHIAFRLDPSVLRVFSGATSAAATATEQPEMSCKLLWSLA